ncbi:MAG TPA: TonB-dependent receptor plug domain-containing protein, partial [Rhizomicrobium sp.]
MRNFGKILLAGASPVVLLVATQGALAQSTGTQEIETVTVTAQLDAGNGLMNAKPVAKQQSVVTSEFLETQAAGQTVFQSLNFMPGVNFTNNDPYGSSGGNIRMHGQDGNHISLTFDGMPLNDTGNYAIYTNQMPDAEIVDRISASQGSTDVDSPTAAATGGVIAIVSDKPHDTFGAESVISQGSFGEQRYFARIDSGEIGPWDTRVYGTLSYASNDKLKGFGYQRKIQGNFKAYQDMGSLGWFSLAGHWNSNRNYSLYAVDYVPNTNNFSGTLAQTADVIKNPNGSGYVPNPAFNNTTGSFSGVGLDRDFAPSCATNRTGSNNNAGAITDGPQAGRTDYTMTTCSFWYRPRINPSDTGNIRFQSLWHLTQ